MFVKSLLLSEHSEAARRVRIAREQLHAGDEVDPSYVRPLILESWRRSRSAGVDPGWALKSPSKAQTARADARRGQGVAPDRRLAQASAPILQLLTNSLSDHSFVLMLTDRQQRTVWISGIDAFVREAELVNKLAGEQWREEEIGTDAVALSHVIGEPVQVHWYEHYSTGLDLWTGNSCPIRDPSTGRVCGTINVYAYGCIAHPQAFELAKDAASIIERQLALGDQSRRVRLLEAYETHVGRFPDEPVICLDAEGMIVGLSRSASTPLRIANVEARGRALLSLPGVRFHGMTDPIASIRSSREVDLRCGDEQIAAELRTVQQEAEVAGFLLRLRAPSVGRSALRRPENPWVARYRFESLLGRSDALSATIDRARRIAARDHAVLIVGESGTGKELLAHAIHADSPRASGPFVPLNCGGVGGELLAAELFGYEEGAFTGASRSGRIGKLELADRGTLFLDEIEAMSPGMQVHLLRFLEDRSVLRVGSERPRNVDVRIIGATNVDLSQLVRAGHFRADLFYRLNVCPISMPPLRARPQDIAILADHILAKEQLGKVLDPAALARLERHTWPGNVRELRNTLVQAATNSPGPTIGIEDLDLIDDSASQQASPVIVPNVLTNAELRTLREVLERHKGCVASAAAELDMHRVTLYRKLKRHGLHRVQGYH